MTTTDTLRTIEKTILAYLESTAAKLPPQGDIPATALWWVGDTLRLVGMQFPLGREDKDAAADILAEVTRALDARAVATILTAWISKVPGGLPSQAPDRKEIVIVSVQTRERRSHLWIFDLQRTDMAAPRVISTAPLSHTSEARWAGRFVDLFDRPNAHIAADVRAYAQSIAAQLIAPAAPTKH